MKWYKNKWGWVGALVGIFSIILVYTGGLTSGTFNSLLVFGWLFPSPSGGGLCNIFQSLCGGDVVGYAIASVIIGYPLQIISGFILGLILEKFWRKR